MHHYLLSIISLLSPLPGRFWRRWRDSNPRYPKVQLISSQPRYDHFDTSPYRFTAEVLYQPIPEKSRFFKGFVILFYQLQHFPQLSANVAVILPAMGTQAEGTVLDSLFVIPEAAAAILPQGVQRTITEQAAEPLRVRAWMAGEILTFPVLKKIIMAHHFSLISLS